MTRGAARTGEQHRGRPDGSRGADRGDDPAHRTARAVAGTWWGDRLSRVGMVAQGVVYLILGYLIARIGAGALGQVSSSRPASGPGVAQALEAQPGGRAMLAALGWGLLLYAMFSALDAVLHHDTEEPTKRWGDRLLSAWGVVFYGAFGGYCLLSAVTSGGQQQSAQQSDQQSADWSASVLRWPAGWLWLGAVGVVLFVIAAFLISRCARLSFRGRLERDRMGRLAWRSALVLGVAGYGGRAVLFGVVGWFVMVAAVKDDPSAGQGIDGSARHLAATGFGQVLLFVTAVTVAAYGLYLFVEARYRRV